MKALSTSELVAKLQIQALTLHVEHVPELKPLIELAMGRLEEQDEQIDRLQESLEDVKHHIEEIQKVL